MRRAAVAMFAFLLAGAAPGACLAAPYQNGVTTEDEVLAELGQPESFALQSDGSATFVYKINASSQFLNFFPVLSLLAETVVPDSTTLTFTFDPSTRLTGYSES